MFHARTLFSLLLLPPPARVPHFQLLQVLARLRHPHCLLLLGICLDQGKEMLLSEYCVNGSLWDVLHSNRVINLTRERRVVIAQQMASALRHQMFFPNQLW